MKARHLVSSLHREPSEPPMKSISRAGERRTQRWRSSLRQAVALAAVLTLELGCVHHAPSCNVLRPINASTPAHPRALAGQAPP
jgi:hypothetical protein